MTVPQIVAQAQALARQYANTPGSSVTDFIAGRVDESGE